jgi:hypothetical protein
MIGVKGWMSATKRRGSGIEAVGTKPLPKNGRSISGIGRLLAASTLLLTRPSATETQVRASAVSKDQKLVFRVAGDHPGPRIGQSQPRARKISHRLTLTRSISPMANG